MSRWPMVRLGEVLNEVKRPVDVDPTKEYREIGIRSHGKGTFHKEPGLGLELGNKRVFHIHPGDFVLNIVFAWEGAVALAGPDEEGYIGSHRFPTFLADQDRLDAKFLLYFFRTRRGLDLLGSVSPGGAGRNRTLNRKKFLEIEVQIPPLRDQRETVALLDHLFDRLAEAGRLCKRSAETAEKLFAARQRELFRRYQEHKHILVEDVADVRGGIQKCPSREARLNPVRYLTVAHVQRNYLNLTDERFFEVSEGELERWQLQPYDLLVVEGNGSQEQVGRTALFRGEIDKCVHQNHLIRVRCNTKRMDPEFLNAFLNSPLGQEVMIERARTTSGLYNLSVRRIKSIPVPDVPAAARREVVQVLDTQQLQRTKMVRANEERLRHLLALGSAVINRLFPSD